MIPAALMLAAAGTADAGGYGSRYGHYGGGHEYSRGARHYAPRHHRGSRHGFRQGFGHRGHRGFGYESYRYGNGHHRSGIGYGLRHGHIRARHYIPTHDYDGSITLHFGY
ncbi:MAG: hypothetical protein RQ847_04970 [Wenzhouxiangellaceae bacterium]|nr:hypothetical protein [Wenzhouxiangellaceae bacterium]